MTRDLVLTGQLQETTYGASAGVIAAPYAREHGATGASRVGSCRDINALREP
jgi:hypothetical protein